MKITETCIDCLLSRVKLECALCHASPSLTEATMTGCRSVMNEIRSAPLSHPQIASRIHRRAYELLENPDPFAELKRQGNRQATEVCKEVRDNLLTFRDYVLASVIANTFDYGVKGHTVEENFSVFFLREFARGLTVDHTDKIASLCSRVVYLSDNCGEIVLDRLLIEYLKGQGSHVTLAVKEAPILNDATLQDARDLGLDTIADQLTTTAGVPRLGYAGKLFLTISGRQFPGARSLSQKGWQILSPCQRWTICLQWHICWQRNVNLLQMSWASRWFKDCHAAVVVSQWQRAGSCAQAPS